MLYSYKKYLLILESKRERQLRTKYIDKLGMSEDIFNQFYSNKNAEWLLKIYSNIPDDKKQEINNKGGKSLVEILLKYAEMFDNNKDNVSVKRISDITSLDEMKQVLDQLRDFDGAEDKFDDDDIWVLLNSYEWFIFKPLSYEASELANNKLRDSNWCTTYGSAYFKEHLGPEGALIYVCNKFDKTKDVAIEFNDDLINAWDWTDSSTNYSTLSELIEDTWEENEEPYVVLMENLEKLEDDAPSIDYDEARENAMDEIMNWQYSKYNELDIYYNYVWKHVDDDEFLDAMKDYQYEIFNDDWEYESDLKEKLIELLEYDYKNYDNEREQIIKYFKEQMKEMNEENEVDPDDLYYYDIDNVDMDSIKKYINDNCSDDDAKELIETFGFEEKLIDTLVNDYMNNFSNAKDYVEQIYGHTTSEAISYIQNYIKWRELAEDIVEDMDDEELRRYV